MSISFKWIACVLGLVVCLNAPAWAQQPVTSPDGGLASVGAKADSADTNYLDVNTLMAFTKGLVKIFSDVWDSVNHRLKVDGSGVVQPVSATALPLPTGAASEATLSTRVSDATFTGRFPAAFTSADSISAQTASFMHGGMMGWNSAASKWDRLQLDASDNLKVSVQNASLAVTGTFWQATQPISGSITANAGTNLNTSALALESGGNLASIASGVGTQSDVAVTSDTTGTLSSKLRGLVKMFADVWDGTNHWLKVSIQNATMAVTQSGTWTVQPGNTPNTVAWKVDGSAVTQPVSGTFYQATQPVSLASVPSHAVTNAGTFAVQPSSSGATGAAPPSAGSYTVGLGSGATGGWLAGIAVGDNFKAVNVSTATTTLLVTGVSGRHVRITSLDISTAAANNVALISGTGATCGTGTTGMNGGTTAASGWNFAANGGIVKGVGFGTVYRTTATGDSVCVITSAATQLSGNIGYAIY